MVDIHDIHSMNVEIGCYCTFKKKIKEENQLSFEQEYQKTQSLKKTITIYHDFYHQPRLVITFKIEILIILNCIV